jgi:hypothetical protein
VLHYLVGHDQAVRIHYITPCLPAKMTLCPATLLGHLHQSGPTCGMLQSYLDTGRLVEKGHRIAKDALAQGDGEV